MQSGEIFELQAGIGSPLFELCGFNKFAVAVGSPAQQAQNILRPNNSEQKWFRIAIERRKEYMPACSCQAAAGTDNRCRIRHVLKQF